MDSEERAILPGLTWQETREFKRLDENLPFDGQGVWPQGGFPTHANEQRWLELWSQHRRAVTEQRGQQREPLLWW